MKNKILNFILAILMVLMVVPATVSEVCAEETSVKVTIENSEDTEITIWTSSKPSYTFIANPINPTGTITDYLWKYKLSISSNYEENSIPVDYPFSVGVDYPGDIEAQVIGVKYDKDQEFTDVTSNVAILHIISPISTIITVGNKQVVPTGSNVVFQIIPTTGITLEGYRYKIDDGIQKETSSNEIAFDNITAGTHELVLTAFKCDGQWNTIAQEANYPHTCLIEAIDPIDIDISIDNDNLIYGDDATVTLSGSFATDFTNAMAKTLSLEYGKKGEDPKTKSVSSLSFNIKTLLGSDYSAGEWFITPKDAYTYTMFPPASNNYFFKNNSLTFTISEPIEYNIIKGAGAKINVSLKKDVVFASDADFEKFVEVQIDDTKVNSENYTVDEGSTIITLSAGFLSSLEDGKHSLRIVSTDGYASTSFKISRTSTPPDTGVGNSGSNLIFVLSSLSFLVALGYVLFSKKRNN